MTAPNPRKFGAISALTVAAISVVAFTIGFYILPSPDQSGTVWQRICRAAGFIRTAADYSRQVAPSGFTSVVVPHAMLDAGTPEQIGRGATVALRCTVCHGAQGMSGANAPNLAGQYSEVIYKQLIDYQRGSRTDPVMNAMVASLSEDDIRDLAFYYAYLPRAKGRLDLSNAPGLVRVGAPMRNIPPCASCHGDKDGKAGAPELNGEPKTYLRRQLTAFANGSRKNDANAAMRSVARQMSIDEMALVINYYASTSP